jgi:hypothetical protein
MNESWCVHARTECRRQAGSVYIRLCIFTALICAFVLVIPATSYATTVTATWNPNPEPDVAGYQLMYGTASGSYTTVIDAGKVTSYSFSVTGGVTYYFVLQAYNTAGAYSPYSNEVAFTVPLPAAPSLSSLSPSSGAAGTIVTITGANFGSSQSGSSVSFNGVAATPSSWSATRIVAAVPAGAGTGNVVAIIAGVPSNGLSFTVASGGGSGGGGGAGGGGGGLSPFNGTPAPIPGQIAAANFDNGGEGVAYHDTSAGNSGGQYRNTDVDLEASSEGGFDVGWTSAGEWLDYTVNVASAGNYTVQLRVASPGGASMHLGFNTSSNVWKSVSIPATGGWQNWQTVSVPVTLGAGSQQMTVLFDSGGMNLQYANVTSSGGGSAGSAGSAGGGLSPFNGTPAPIPGQIAAANFDNGGEGVAYHDTSAGNSGGQYRNTDVDLEASSEGGFDVGWTSAGEWLNYTVNVASAGNYTVQLRVASPGGASMHLGFNTSSNVSTSVSIPATGGWQNWQTVSVPVTLGAGSQQMTVLFDNGGMNLQYANVTSSGGGSAGSGGSGGSGGGGGSGGLTPFSGTPVSLPGTVAASDFDNGGEGVAYHDTSAGNSGGQYRNTDVDLEASSEGGFDVGWTAPGEWLNYTVNVTSSGNRTVQLRVASPGGATIHVGFNGPSQGQWKSVSIPATGGWQNWQTISVPVTLGPGVQQLTLMFDTGGTNIRTIVVN